MVSSVLFSFADAELLAGSFSGSLVMFLLAKIERATNSSYVSIFIQ